MSAAEHRKGQKAQYRPAKKFFQSPEWFRRVFDEAPIGVAIVGLDHRLVRVNRTFCRLLGYPARKLTSLTFPEITYPEDVDQAVALARRVFSSEIPSYTLEKRLIRKNGELVWIKLTATVMRDEEGQPLYGLAMVENITGWRQAEERYRALFEEAPAMYVISSNRPEGPIIADCNEMFLRTLGYSRSDVIGRPMGDFYTEESRQKLLQGGYQQALEGRFIAQERRLVTRQGRVVSTLLRAVPEYDSGGSVAGTRAMFIDITDRRQTEEALLAKTAQLETITQAMMAFLQSGSWGEASRVFLRGALTRTESEYGFVGAVVEGPVLRILAHEGIVWDSVLNREFYEAALRTYREKGYLEFTNFENLFGNVITTGKVLLANEPVGHPHAGGLPPGHPPLRHFLGVPILVGGEVVGIIGVANRPGGYSGAEQAELEVLAGMAGVLYDSYRRQQRELLLEEQLRHSQKMEAMGRLAGGIAHDFNNLLTAISGYAELLLSRLGPDASHRRELDQIKKSAERGALLTHQLLAFGRNQVVQPEALDLNAVVRQMEKMLRLIMGEDIKLISHLAPELGAVRADLGQIEQVIMNLVVNARDAIPAGGRLTIQTADVEWDELAARQFVALKPGRYVMLAVGDNGVGMDAETQSRIFEPFFTTKEKGKGTGLGLSTVYGIVQQSGGEIWVTSQVGQGTTFKIYLPRAEETARTPELGRSSSITGSETILVVEDEPSVRQLASLTLQSKGYQVLEAGDALEALQICRDHPGPIHLVLTDLVMPHLTGCQLGERLQSTYPDTKIMYMSGYTGDILMKRGIVSLDRPFLQKPFSLDLLLRKVRETLDS